MSNNSAAMREALEAARDLLLPQCNGGTAFAKACGETVNKIMDALSAPPRNCDMGDAADWESRFGEECDKGHICSDCPVGHVKTRMAIKLDKGARCEFVWSQMPYNEEGGAR